MRVILATVACLAVVMTGIARPAPAAACTGCLEPLADVVEPADRVLVVTVSGVSPTACTFIVDRVLKGTAGRHLTLAAVSGEDYPLGSRWILVLYPGHGLDTANTWRINADGSLSLKAVDAPTTLAGFIAFFAAPATDTPRVTQEDRSAPGGAIVLVAAFLLGVALVVRRRPGRRRGSVVAGGA